jgi:hypothetical protein
MPDELSRAVQRRLVHRLQELGLLIPKERQRAILLECKARGRTLKREMLKALLGPGDYGYLHSERAFGLRDDRFRKSIGSILASGYFMGFGLTAYLGTGRDPCPDAAEVCALFNAMIMMFDLCLDDVRGGAEDLSRVFDEGTMVRLADDPGAGIEIAADAGSPYRPEIRILFKVVCAFYSMARRNARGSLDSETWGRLNALLVDAYRAEIRSVYGLAPLDRSAAAAATKILPFEIMLQIAMLGNAALTASHHASACDLARNIGTVLWLADDLTDLAKDLDAGSVNALVCEAQGLHSLELPEDRCELRRRLLTGEFIGRAVERLGSSLDRVARALDAVEPCRPELRDFRDLILAFARG